MRFCVLITMFELPLGLVQVAPISPLRAVTRRSRGPGEGVRRGEAGRALAEAPVAEQPGGGVHCARVADLDDAGAGRDVLVADPVGDDVPVHVAGAPASELSTYGEVGVSGTDVGEGAEGAAGRRRSAAPTARCSRRVAIPEPASVPVVKRDADRAARADSRRRS